MRQRRNKFQHQKRSAISPIIISVIGLIAIVLISVPLAENMSQKYKVDQEIIDLQNEIALVENQNLDLDKMISHLNSEEFSDEQARLNFNLKKSGESVAVIQMNENDASNIPDEFTSDFEISLSNKTKWLKYFFDKGI